MNNKIHIDAHIARLLFYKYRSILSPVIVILISLFVFFQYGIPEIQNFFSMKAQVESSEQTLAVMTQNYNTVVSIDDANVTQMTTIANRALPSGKDFAGILTAISAAAAKTGITLNDYSFPVGDITTLSSAPNTNTEVPLSLTINGTFDQVKQFLTALSQQFPLSETTGVTLGGTTTSLTTQFFYSPVTKPSFLDTNPITVVSAAQQKALLDLAQNAGETSIASPSPQLSPNPVSSSGAR